MLPVGTQIGSRTRGQLGMATTKRFSFGALFGSVAFKILGVVFALGVTTAVAIFFAQREIAVISDDVGTMVETTVPPLQSAAAISDAVTELKDAVNELQAISSIIAYDAAAARVSNARATLSEMLGTLDESKQATLAGDAANLTESLDALLAARLTELNADVANTKNLVSVSKAARTLTSDLLSRIEQATFDLNDAGNSAFMTVSNSIRRLFSREVDALRIALLLEKELANLNGVILALTEAEDLGTRSELREAATSSHASVLALFDEAAGNKVLKSEVDGLKRVFSIYKQIIGMDREQLVSRSKELATRRGNVTSALEEITQELLSVVATTSEDILGANEGVVKELLNTDMAYIVTLAKVDSEVSQILTKSMQGAASLNVGYIRALQIEIDALVPSVRAAAEVLPQETRDHVDVILNSANAETGLLATRTLALGARGDAYEAGEAAKGNLDLFSQLVTELSSSAFLEIMSAGEEVVAAGKNAQRLMQVLGLVALGILLAVPFVTYLMIMRPIAQVTSATERLAVGDLAEIKRTGGKHGEIARLFSALSVFRDNLVEKERMQAEAREAEQREHEAQITAERERREREAAEQARKAAEEQREAERERAAAEEKQRLEELAEAERQARHAEQSKVVEQLAEGLRRLSVGDVRYTIAETFPAGYEQLRQDYNAAVVSLREVVNQITESAQTIKANSGEISNAADDLSRRTERAASTLGETAAALTELTVSVQSAADGASQANTTVRGARTNAESASVVVKEAIAAMDRISESSSKISKIISVIDDIAFQTNLLALNAGVEAARAGEAGRGFAVVASEVRALAQRSSEAAREINQLISESGQEVGRGVALVDQTGEALRSIVANVSEIASHMSEIATSAEEQSSGISEINLAVTNLDQTTQQNAAMFEETTAASFSLAQEATNLAEAVSRFVTDSNAAVAASTTTLPDADEAGYAAAS